MCGLCVGGEDVLNTTLAALETLEQGKVVAVKTYLNPKVWGFGLSFVGFWVLGQGSKMLGYL